MRLSVIGFIVLGFTLASTCFAREGKDRDRNQVGHRNVAGGINLYSRSKEIALGNELARDVEREAQLIDDPILCEYINRVGQNLVNNSDATFLVTVKLVRSSEVNAFALPGGHVYVNSALMRAAETEAELAGALAHEIAHVAARHYTKGESLRDLLSLAGIPLLLIGGAPAIAIQQGLQAAAPLAVNKFSRGSEKQADILGVQYLYRAGYDPTAIIDFLERISVRQHIEPGPFLRMLSMHPSIPSRIQTLQAEIDQDLSPREQYLVQTSEFETMKARLAAIEGGTYMPWRFPHSPTGDSDAKPVLRRSAK